MDTCRVLRDIFFSGLAQADPAMAVERHLRQWKHTNAVHIAAIGKASVPMAQAAIRILGQPSKKGKVRSAIALAPVRKASVRNGLRILPADHPVCGPNTLKSSRLLLKTLSQAGPDDTVLFLISGGGSAMFEVLPDAVSLKDYQALVSFLLKSGADISELNAVRSACSLVKAGRTLSFLRCKSIRTLILSDVIGDDPKIIASGPTIPAKSSLKTALRVVSKYHIPLSLFIRTIGKIKKRHASQNQSRSPISTAEIIGSNRIALEASRKNAEQMGYKTRILTYCLAGEARDAGRWLAKETRKILAKRKSHDKPVCLLAGGETTVTVKGTGTGGRNQELSLAFLNQGPWPENVSFLSAGTDGIDGFTKSAGAFVTARVIRKAQKAGLDASAYLDNNDSHTFFRKADGLFDTGPTGTNVMDIQIVLID
jgi:glycerate-2-kinase